MRSRVDKLRQLRLVMGVMWVASFISFFYQVSVSVIQKSECNSGVNSFFRLLNHFCAYFLWQYPVICLLWSTKPTSSTVDSQQYLAGLSGDYTYDCRNRSFIACSSDGGAKSQYDLYRLSGQISQGRINHEDEDSIIADYD